MPIFLERPERKQAELAMESRGQLTLQLIFILEHLSYEGKAERAGSVGLFSLEKVPGSFYSIS